MPSRHGAADLPTHRIFGYFIDKFDIFPEIERKNTTGIKKHFHGKFCGVLFTDV